ncbi:hypothetical protein VMCG_09679 [Cytospora schulzeri]|uniref:Uncharacterized protein n=1 Tax=Cytospora schulzeri TaxID=448051 RepID=A0A423VK72_9PEZI|nr:hypothetical protein VMCG_09679 [Valsa malicola]
MAKKCFCGRYFGSEGALLQHQRSSAVPICTSAFMNPFDGTRLPMPKSASQTLLERFKGLRPRDKWMVRDIGVEVRSIMATSLQLSGLETPVSSSSASRVICTYNWANMAQPTVYVPGGAPVYQSIPLPIKVQPDSGFRYVDQNASRLPKYPFEVVFHAVEKMEPTFRFDSIDVLLNRNSLRKFFDFCMGRTQDSFRVNLFLVNNTLIIERCVKSPKEYLNNSGGSGFGHNFEQATTRLPPGLQDSSSHHRVLRYKLGGLECAVRFEVDASYDDPNESVVQVSGAGIPSGVSQRDDIESLGASLSSMALGNSANTPAANDISMRAITRGSGTPQTSVAELKSHTINKGRPKAIPQLWFGRTRYLITGYHQSGIFAEVKVDDLSKNLVDWENKEANQNGLRKMTLLLSRLRDVVGMTEGKDCVAIYEKGVGSALRVFVSTSGKGPLPDSIIEKFWEAEA